LETNTQVISYTNYTGINSLNEIGLTELPVSAWQKNPSGYYFYFKNFRYTKTVIPDNIINLAINDPNFYIVLNDAEEGYAYHSFAEVYEFVNNFNLQHKVIYATGHDNVETVYKYWLEKKKLQKNFLVWSHNLWYHRMRDWINDCSIPVDFQKTQWFCSMNNRPRLHRLFAVTYLDALSILEDGIVTANDSDYENHQHNTFEKVLLSRIPNIHERYQKLISQYIPIVKNKLPLIVDTNDLANKSLPNDLHPKIYDKTLINLVTETFYFPEYNFIDETFITEKTWKAFTAGQIPVIIGPKGIVSRLRSLGLDMFDDIIDHSYDNADDSERLFLAIESMQKVMSNNKIQNLNLKTLSRRKQNRKICLFGIKNIDKSLQEVL
jgi:hypothetical protein